MKKLFALALVVLGLAACQTEPNELDVNVGGEVLTTVNISIPETDTRSNSALGAFENVDLENTDLTIRYILQVFTADGQASSHRDVKYEDDKKSVAFDVRLIPGRDYKFVCWADIVSETEKVDVHYNTSDLTNIKLNGEWDAMDETRDAFTVSAPVNDYNGASVINIELKRPFAKLRVKTTDLTELGYFGVTPRTAKVTYSTSHRSTFNAFESKAESADVTSKVHEYTIADYEDNSETTMTLFTDYFFAEEDIVKFDLEVFDAKGESIRVNSFTTDIPVKRNYVTTIAGNILTDGNNVNVTIEDAFENVDDNGNTTDPNYEYKTISSDKEFLTALNTSGKYIVISDLHVANAGDTVNTLATRAANGKTVLINLNGKTITVDNQSDSALVTLGNDDALIFAGEGNIVADADSKNKLVDGGQVVVTGAAEVDEDVADVKVGLEALTYICENGGEFTMTDNIQLTEVLLASSTNPIVVNGNGYSLSSAQNRIVRIEKSNANVTFNNVNFVSSAVMIYPSDVRGVAIDPNLSNVTLTLNNCTIDFTDKTTNDWTYAVNVAGNGTGHKVTINGGTYEGANVVNVHGAKNTIVVKNATLNSLYPNSDLYYGACIYVAQNKESSVYAEGNTFNGNNAWAFNIGYTPLVEKNNTDNTKFIAVKVGSNYYYNIAEAFAAAEDGATVKVLQSHTCKVGATVANGKTLTLDLNGKTIKGTDSSTGSFGLITNKGNLTVKNGTMTLKAENNRAWNAYSSVISNTVGGNLVVEDVTIEHLGGTDMAYGIDNLTNGKGTSAVATINEGAIVKSPYRAVRMFLNGIEANNSLTVNAGAVIEGANKSIWMQDPSKNANTGTLVVNEGATLNGDVYLFVTAGSTEWPVSVSIAASAVNGEVLTGNVPEGYEVVEQNGVWTVVAYTNVTTADELVGALADGKNVIFGADITVAATKGGYNKAGILQNKAQVINGNGHTLTVTGAGATWDCAIYTNGGTIKNLTVAGAMRGIFTAGTSADLYIDNVTFSNVIYTFNSDGGNKAYGVYISNSNVNGWTSHSNVHKEVVYTNCSFGEGSGYKYCRPYGKTLFVNCTFCPGYTVDQSQTNEITFTDCTWE